ncbi:hypothetical protein ACFFGT_10475 [Mucilaginibacter angelicae]|uniref:Uncharacterized protein n=1 Tax=Mucilaginibacter angelicae TaxID=869718 RepID=A0ABV6L566_9SPHI
MKNISKILTSMVGIMLVTLVSYGQNYVKTDLGVSFLSGKKFIQSFDFNLNRTNEVQNNNGGIYFLYTATTHYYIIPTVDASIGESVSAANNNIVTQIVFGKVFKSTRHRDGSSVSEFKSSLEISPTYNADKTFAEKLYYVQLKLTINPITSTFTGKGSKYFAKQVFSFAIDPVLNLGTHDSQTYKMEKAYSAGGFNTSLSLRLNKLDNKDAPYTDWSFKLSGDGYRLFSEIPALYAKDYYGQLAASVDKAVNSKISLSLAYKYGNENAKYSDVHSLTLGFKYKY